MTLLFQLLMTYIITMAIFIFFVLRWYPKVRTVKDLVRTIDDDLGMVFMWLPLLNTAVLLTVAIGFIICKIINFINDIKIR